MAGLSHNEYKKAISNAKTVNEVIILKSQHDIFIKEKQKTLKLRAVEVERLVNYKLKLLGVVNTKPKRRKRTNKASIRNQEVIDIRKTYNETDI